MTIRRLLFLLIVTSAVSIIFGTIYYFVVFIPIEQVVGQYSGDLPYFVQDLCKEIDKLQRGSAARADMEKYMKDYFDVVCP